MSKGFAATLDTHVFVVDPSGAFDHGPGIFRGPDGIVPQQVNVV